MTAGFRGRRTGRDRAGGTAARTAVTHDAVAGVGCAPTGAHDLVVKIDQAIQLAFADDAVTLGGDRLPQPGWVDRVRADELARAADVDTPPVPRLPEGRGEGGESRVVGVCAAAARTNHGSVGARSETG